MLRYLGLALWALPYVLWRWKGRVLIVLILALAAAWYFRPQEARPYEFILPNGVKIESHCALRFHEFYTPPKASTYEGHVIFWIEGTVLVVKGPQKAPSYYEKDCLGDR